MVYSLFIGRFQPFHSAHLADIKTIIARNEVCVIAIAAANKNDTWDNALTIEERKQIITNVMHAEKIDPSSYKIVEITDIDDDTRWVKHVEKHIPPCKKVYSGSKWTISLFEKAENYEVIPITLLKDKSGNIISATHIRNLILEDRDISEYLHPKTQQFIKEIDFKKRLINFQANQR